MKRLSLFLAIIILVSSFTYLLKAQNKPKESPKVYQVSLTKEQWFSVLNGLESIKNTVKVSNMSAIQSTFISDSLIGMYQNEFYRQLNLQFESEKIRPEVKKDTTSKSKKN